MFYCSFIGLLAKINGNARK